MKLLSVGAMYAVLLVRHTVRMGPLYIFMYVINLHTHSNSSGSFIRYRYIAFPVFIEHYEYLKINLWTENIIIIGLNRKTHLPVQV